MSFFDRTVIEPEWMINPHAKGWLTGVAQREIIGNCWLVRKPDGDWVYCDGDQRFAIPAEWDQVCTKPDIVQYEANSSDGYDVIVPTPVTNTGKEWATIMPNTTKAYAKATCSMIKDLYKKGSKKAELKEWFAVPGYERLASILRQAYDQAAKGKGEERHANQKPFHEQRMQTIAREVGIGFPLGQAMKKIGESQGLGTEAAKKELLGAIVYIAGAILYMEDNKS